MLESISIKKIATYDDKGIQIVDLKKVNFIYGANGSGKTTITKLIHKPNDPLFAESSLTWRGNLPIKALVYNKDFRNANFGNGKLDGVFTLGQATKEEIEAIDQMRVRLVEIKEEILKKKESLNKVSELKDQHEEDYKENSWIDIYKKYETEFKEAFVGVMKNEAFKEKILYEFNNNTSLLKTFIELTEKSKIIFGDRPKSMSLISEIGFERFLEIEEDVIWGKKILGKADLDIAKLIQKLNLNDWVNEGKNYLQKDEICPFCQQPTITENFRKQLEEYFDESFSKDTQTIKEYFEEYISLASNIINLLTDIETTEKANINSKLNVDLFSAYFKTLSSQIISNKELLKNKIKELSRSIDLISNKEQFGKIQELIYVSNKAITKHNKIVSNYPIERASLVNDIWKYLVDENNNKIQVYNKKSKGFLKGIDNLTKQYQILQNEYRVLDNQIKEATKNITSIQPSVDNINQTLKSYGFTNFEIVPSKIESNQYQIQREDGTIAESTLSEGEITFITFLYFLQLAKGSIKQESITEERILIVDDPISSLDSNVLFVVSSLIKEVIKSIKKGDGNIKQLILFTHNVYFHKEVSFIDGRTTNNGDTFYWILRRKDKISEIQSFEMKNPIHSSYDLLWLELKSNRNSGITTQNIMRRIIENYFKLLGKYGDDNLINKFPSVSEQEICRSLISWINEGSHSIPDDLYIEHMETTIEKYHEVFKNIFIHTGHEEHYKMMMCESYNQTN
jgi:wobble nucleotide-excising tRNase